MQHPEGGLWGHLHWAGAAAGPSWVQAGALGKEVPGVLEDGYAGGSALQPPLNPAFGPTDAF